MSLLENIQPAVKKETKRVIVITLLGLLLMWILFAAFHFIMPDKVPLDYTVFLGGLAGGCVAVLNFFLMGLAVQKAAAAEDEGTARMKIKASYSQRFMMQVFWVIIAIIAPCFHFVAGIAPLLFPGTGIKIVGIFHNKN
nr:ATP synthase subunit I [uncultured Blautia sp.]